MNKNELNNIVLPVYKVLKKETANVYVASGSVEELGDEDLNILKAGDIVEKTTGKQRHTYIVTYKEEKHGICLSYFNAGYTETVSYDYVDGHWVFNSKDVVPIENVEDAVEGTIDKVLGLNSSGKLVKGSVSGGTKLYRHEIVIGTLGKIWIIDTRSTSFGTNVSLIDMFMLGILLDKYISCMYYNNQYQLYAFPSSEFNFKYLNSDGTIGTITTENNVTDIVTEL